MSLKYGAMIFPDGLFAQPAVGAARAGAADRFGPAFAIDEPPAIAAPVVFASPHSGRTYPDSFLEACRAPLLDLRRIEDAYVDRLIAEAPLHGAPIVRGLVGRACVDLNRGESEIDAGMFVDPAPGWSLHRSPRVDAGLGCIPRIAHGGRPIYEGKLQRAEAEARIAAIYRPYHRALEALLKRSEAMFGRVWLVDWHSMPSEIEAGRRAPDIVLGDRHGDSCDPRLVDLLESQFRRRGYSVVRNAPYAGGYATATHGRPMDDRHAVQVEMNRALYLDESAVEPGAGFLQLKADLTDIVREICLFAREDAGVAGMYQKEKAASDADAAKALGRKRP